MAWRDVVRLDLNRLPEKDYFSFSEIAERWECDTSLIQHYIFEQKSLRIAAHYRPSDQHRLLPISYFNGQHNFIGECIWEVVNSNPPPYRIRRPYFENFVNFNFTEITNLNLLEVPLFNQVDEETQFVFLYLDTDSLSGADPGLIEAKLVREEYEDYGSKFYSENNSKCYLMLQFEEKGKTLFAFDFIPLKEFLYITKTERDRFEKEFEITKDTKSVQQQVSKKTENLQLELMQLFAGTMLKEGLSNNPHTDVEQIIKKLAVANKTLPCTKETLAKYLKENRF
jgi:hypothetical protein